MMPDDCEANHFAASGQDVSILLVAASEYVKHARQIAAHSAVILPKLPAEQRSQAMTGIMADVVMAANVEGAIRRWLDRLRAVADGDPRPDPKELARMTAELVLANLEPVPPAGKARMMMPGMGGN